VFTKELRYTPTTGRLSRPKFGANAEIWALVGGVRQDSADLASARRARATDDHAKAVEGFVAWMDAEDFGDDPLRMRRDAWR
jgi:hypothetical protein